LSNLILDPLTLTARSELVEGLSFTASVIASEARQSSGAKAGLPRSARGDDAHSPRAGSFISESARSRRIPELVEGLSFLFCARQDQNEESKQPFDKLRASGGVE
jgi:hypothetical protein